MFEHKIFLWGVLFICWTWCLILIFLDFLVFARFCARNSKITHFAKSLEKLNGTELCWIVTKMSFFGHDNMKNNKIMCLMTIYDYVGCQKFMDGKWVYYNITIVVYVWRLAGLYQAYRLPYLNSRA